MNRSIQAEGSFAQIKARYEISEDLYVVEKKMYLQKVFLLAIAHNINKLHNKIQSNRTGKHLFKLKERLHKSYLKIIFLIRLIKVRLYFIMMFIFIKIIF